MLITSNHLEQLSRSFSAITIDPYRSLIYYFFPNLSAFFSNYQKLDPNMAAMCPPEPTKLMLKEIVDLKHLTTITRDVKTYIALNHQFSSDGGPWSFSSPALFIPAHHLYRRAPLPPFPQEKDDHNLTKNEEIFSDDETRFFISRELAQIEGNHIFLKVAIKVSILASIFIFYTASHSWLVSLYPFMISAALYVLSERFLNQEVDLRAIEILGKRKTNAVQVAIGALEKIRRQNLKNREQNSIAKWYITKSGNILLDFLNPSLSKRIRNIKSCERKS